MIRTALKILFNDASEWCELVGPDIELGTNIIVNRGGKICTVHYKNIQDELIYMSCN